MKSLLRIMVESATRTTGSKPLDVAARIVQKAVTRAMTPLPNDARRAGNKPKGGASAPGTRTTRSTPAATNANTTTTTTGPAMDGAHRTGARTAGFIEGNATHAGLSRSYKLFVPADLGPRPSLVVMLHGCTQDADDFARGTQMNLRAEAQGFLVLYPNQSRTANAAACWNWFRSEDQHRGAGEPAFIAELAIATIARYDVDPQRVFVAGLSAGGAMAAILLEAYPDVFAAAAIHSGLASGAATNLPDALSAMRRGTIRVRPSASGASASAGRSAIVFHGDADTTVHPSNAGHIVSSLLGTDAERAAGGRSEHGVSPGGQGFDRTIYRDARGVDGVERWTLHDAGHAWSGGDAKGSYTDARGIDATQEMLRFFAAHPRR